jgi:hypothetical protein
VTPRGTLVVLADATLVVVELETTDVVETGDPVDDGPVDSPSPPPHPPSATLNTTMVTINSTRAMRRPIPPA